MSREPENIHAELAALADGTLPAEQREPLLARVAESSELASELEDQQRAVSLVRTLERVPAPTLLRRSIELAATGEAAVAGEGRHASGGLATSGRGGSTKHARAVGLRRAPRQVPRLAAFAAFAAAVAVVLVLALTTGGGASAPTVRQASSAGLHAATRAAPAESRHDAHQLTASVAGIHYPYWGGQLGWRASGARTDTVGGRTITTVFYSDARARLIGYSIVSGSALRIPAGSTPVEHRGVSFHVISGAHPTVVTWREAGHTCILTSRDVSAGTLMRLAAWERAA